MVRHTILIALIAFLVIASFAAPGYCDDAYKKLGRGLCNIGTFPFEILLQSSRVNTSDGPMAALTWGVLKGIGMSFVRLGVGFYETVTFPIAGPNHYGPILTDPEFVFEDSNW
jgi:putative exosortase-associated protein (TIGR04073 family)